MTATKLRRVNKSCGVSAIKTVAKRQRISFRCQTEDRQLGKKSTNDLFVFFALEAACAVNQYAAGSQKAKYSARDDELLVGHSSDIFRSQSPSHVNPPAHDAGICAWRINENTIEWRKRHNFFWRLIEHPIVSDNANDGGAQPADIIFQDLESLAIAVTCNDDSLVLHELSEIGCFAAWRRAGVEDFFSWAWIE